MCGICCAGVCASRMVKITLMLASSASCGSFTWVIAIVFKRKVHLVKPKASSTTIHSPWQQEKWKHRRWTCGAREKAMKEKATSRVLRKHVKKIFLHKSGTPGNSEKDLCTLCCIYRCLRAHATTSMVERRCERSIKSTRNIVNMRNLKMCSIKSEIAFLFLIAAAHFLLPHTVFPSHAPLPRGKTVMKEWKIATSKSCSPLWYFVVSKLTKMNKNANETEWFVLRLSSSNRCAMSILLNAFEAYRSLRARTKALPLFFIYLKIV